MKLNEPIRYFMVMAIFCETLTRVTEQVEACLPRLNFFQFGQGAESNEAEQAYDQEAIKKSEWTTSDWIEKNNHPLELHEVTTKDGYQLQLHRLAKPGHRPVLLVHGMLTSSLAWVMMGPTKSLAFLFYAADYDVWLANTRGSRHGQNHTTLSLSDADFWSFSFHEVGVFDLPAIIDHIRNESSYHQLITVTHSNAFNAFLVLFAQHAEYNERILLLQALAPLAELKNYVKMSTMDVRNIMKFVKNKSKEGSYEVFPAGALRSKCLKQNSEERRECLEYLNLVTGSGQNIRALDPIILGQLIHGGSLKAIEHLKQLWKSGDFVAYDYGAEGNLKVYNTVEPLNYNLTQITVPMVLHFGETDAIATPDGVHQIYAHLLTSIIGVYRVVQVKFNHLDFLCAPDVKGLINDKLLSIVQQYFEGKLKYVIE